MELAKRDLSLVPEQYISYEALYCALHSEYQNYHIYRDPEFKRYLPFLDNLLADRLAMKAPYMFSDLPQQFQTPERLIIAIESKECTNVYHWPKTSDGNCLRRKYARPLSERIQPVLSSPTMCGQRSLSTTVWNMERHSIGSGRCHSDFRLPPIHRRHLTIARPMFIPLPSASLLRRWQSTAIGIHPIKMLFQNYTWRSSKTDRASRRILWR